MHLPTGPASRAARVFFMPEEYSDPSGNTQQFRAFVERTEPSGTPERARPMGLIVFGAVAVVAVIVLAVWLATG